MRRLAVLVLACALAGCANEESEEPFPPTNTDVVTGEFEPGDEVAILVDGGTVVLTATERGTRIDLGGVAEQGVIREGSCDDQGEIAYALDGSESEIDAELIDLVAGRFALVAGDGCGELVSPGD